MEVATAIRTLPAQRRARTFERDCERLRPLGEAFVLRRFGGSLNRADAEDAVSEVLIRLHRRIAEGRPPKNLRAAFFTSVRNAAIDQLRSRAAKPTVALEAVADAAAEAASPVERAESREDAARLQEALQRMRGNYREAIVLRFGLGMTVPEISRYLEISLPAAKKLVLRATQQVKKRLESIEGAEFCPEMREMAQRSLFEKEASGIATDAEGEILRRHFEHCGSCKSFLANLHDTLHDFGSVTLLAITSGDQVTGQIGILDRVAQVAGDAVHGAQVGTEKLRIATYKASGAFSPGAGGDGGGALSVFAGSTQKIIAVCGAGAATTATCLATGVVGPGIGATAPQAPAKDPPAKVKALSEEAASPPVVVSAPSAEEVPAPDPSASSEGSKGTPEVSSPSDSKESTPAPSSPAPQTEESHSEFGFEGGSSPAPEPAPAPAPSTPSSSSSTSSPAPAQAAPVPAPTGGGGGGGSTSGGGSGGGGGGGGSFGFEG